MTEPTLRIAATADIHYGKHSRGQLHDMFSEISRSADVLLLGGDPTDFGLAEEADQLVSDLRAAVHIPMIGVLGNHDFESGEQELVLKVLDQAGVTMLDVDAADINRVAFARACGFAGVFRPR